MGRWPAYGQEVILMKSRGLAIGSALFVVGGILGLVLGRIGPVATVRQTGQTDVMQGYALFNEADQAMSQRQLSSAHTWVVQGTAYLLASAYPLRQLGIRHAGSVASYLETAEYALWQGQATSHQKAVLHTFDQALAPFAHQNFGSISDAQLQKALSQVQTSISG